MSVPGRDRFTDQVLHDEKRHARFVPDVVQRADVPMIQTRERSSFVFQPMDQVVSRRYVPLKRPDGFSSKEAGF